MLYIRYLWDIDSIRKRTRLHVRNTKGKTKNPVIECIIILQLGYNYHNVIDQCRLLFAWQHFSNNGKFSKIKFNHKVSFSQTKTLFIANYILRLNNSIFELWSMTTEYSMWPLSYFKIFGPDFLKWKISHKLYYQWMVILLCLSLFYIPPPRKWTRPQTKETQTLTTIMLLLL